MKSGVIIVALMGLICSGSLRAAEPAIEFDPRPEWGIPPEAHDQPMVKVEPGTTLAKLFGNAIEKVQVRYVDAKVWPDADHQKVKAYLTSILASEHSECYSFQIWSQVVGMPEIECLIEFNQDYQKQLAAEKKSYRTGRLLVWKTEACFRDGTGRWWFVSNFHNYHRAHPQGQRNLSKGP